MSKIKNKILKKGEIIPLTFDPMFTEIFNNEDNICILEEFISYYLDIPLNLVRGNLKLLSRNLKRKNLKSSKKEVDLLLDYNGKKYNIEMSNGWTKEIKERNVVFLSNIHADQLKRGFNEYKEIEESIQINLNNFNSEKNLKTTYYLRNEEGKKFSEKFRIDVINLVKGRKMCYTNNEKENILIDWCKVFTSKTKKELQESLNNILSKKSKEKLVKDVSRLSGDNDMRHVYGNKEKRELELESIFRLKYEQIGIEKGIEQGKIEIAKNMVNKNIDISIIMEVTGLTKEKLLELKQK